MKLQKWYARRIKKKNNPTKECDGIGQEYIEAANEYESKLKNNISPMPGLIHDAGHGYWHKKKFEKAKYCFSESLKSKYYGQNGDAPNHYFKCYGLFLLDYGDKLRIKDKIKSNQLLNESFRNFANYALLKVDPKWKADITKPVLKIEDIKAETKGKLLKEIINLRTGCKIEEHERCDKNIKMCKIFLIIISAIMFGFMDLFLYYTSIINFSILVTIVIIEIGFLGIPSIWSIIPERNK